MKALLFCLVLPLQILAQDITGIWTGSLQSNGSTMLYELVISGKEKLDGYAMTTFTFNGIENVGVKTVNLKSKNGTISLEDKELVYHNYSTPPKRHKLLGSLILTVSGDKMTLNGTFITRSLDFRAKDSYSGTIQLQKQSTAAATKLMAKLEEMQLAESLTFMEHKTEEKKASSVIAAVAANPVASKKEKATVPTPSPAASSALSTVSKGNTTAIPLQTTISEEPMLPQKKRQEAIASASGTERRERTVASLQRIATGAAPSPALAAARSVILPAANLVNRRSEVVSSVSVAADSVVLSLYDNGEIDGDTVSVVLNNQVIIARKGLTATALRTTIYLTPEMGDSVQLTLYAENLGRIAPNTGLLVVQDGTNRHDIRFAGDFQKNAAIILRRKR